jgi:hypothetical protein
MSMTSEMIERGSRQIRPVKIVHIENPADCWACGEPVPSGLVITCRGCGEQMPSAPRVIKY